MILLRTIVSAYVFLVLSLPVFSQPKVDSLKYYGEEIQNDSTRANTYNQIAESYLSLNPDSSLSFANRALEISIKRKLHVLQADAYLNMGVAYFYKNQYALALQYLKYALGFYKMSQSIPGQANTLFNISKVYRNMYKYGQSITYAKESQEFYESLDDKHAIALLNNFLGKDYLKLGEYKTAEKYLKESVKKGADSVLFMHYYLSMGDLLLRGRSNYQRAIRYYNLGLNYAFNLKKWNEVSRVNSQLGYVFTKLGQYDTALFYLNEGYQYYNKLEAKTIQKLSFEYYINYYIQIEDYKNALNYSLQLSSLKDSMFTEQTNSKLAEFEVIYETLKREDEIIILQNNRQIMSLRIAFLSAMVVLVVFLIFYIRKYYRIRIEKADQEHKKLKNELELKDQELASGALNLAQNYELLNRTTNKLVKSQEKSPRGGQDDIQKIIRDLKTQVSDDSFNEFEMRFLKVHNNFYEKLLADYPLLSPNDLRICALLRLNLTSKDIAKILHMSSASVNVSRSRIRKKMNMTQEMNLVTFLMEY